jgi:hypothetical protein
MKTIFKLFLIGAMLVPILGTTGCSSWKHNGIKGNSVFSLPKKKPAKPKKDKGVPVTMGDFLQLERNDVL